MNHIKPYNESFLGLFQKKGKDYQLLRDIKIIFKQNEPKIEEIDETDELTASYPGEFPHILKFKLEDEGAEVEVIGRNMYEVRVNNHILDIDENTAKKFFNLVLSYIY